MTLELKFQLDFVFKKNNTSKIKTKHCTYFKAWNTVL